MGPRRHRSSGRTSTRRRVLNQGRPVQLVPHISDFSHIQVQGAEDDKGEVENQYPFIRKASLQNEIEEEIAGLGRLNYSPAPPPRSPTSRLRPRTFAEATMSTWTRGRGRSSTKKGDSSDATAGGSKNLESLGPFKYTFKKKKKAAKWSPFDLSGAGSEVGSRASSEVGSSRAASPNRQAPTAPQSQNSISVETTGTDAAKGKEVIRDGGMLEEINTHHDQASLRHPVPSSRPLANTSLHLLTCLDPIESDTSDTQSTKDRTEAAMAQLVGAFGSNKIRGVGEEAFDPLVWDPDLPTASADASPRSISATPKPVTYTTVGSLVNPNATPQFTAPNRIQREGSMRRPLMPLGQNRQYDSYLQPRGPPPALNMLSSTNYTQPFSQSPLHYSQTPPSAAARSTYSARFSTAKEQEMLTIQGSRASKTLPKSPSGSPHTPTPANELDSFGGYPSTPTFNFKELTEDEELSLSYNTQGPIQGLEKMQTLQRLAKFDNPMQELARNRLSEFSVSKLQIGGGAVSDNAAAVSLDTLLRDRREAVPVASKVDTNLGSAGNLETAFQFPPSVATSSLTTANSLFGAFNVTTTSTSRDDFPTRPTGYPQPLTAGPPGQRQYHGGSNKTSSNHLENLANPEVRPATSSPRRKFQATSPWTNQYKPNSNNQPDTHNYNVSQIEASDHTKTLDTLPISAVLKYYPHGIPSGMSGNYNPLPVEIQKQMDQLSSEDTKPNLEEKMAKKARELDDWFYGGQRRYQMTAEDHIRELENRQAANPFGPVGGPSTSKKFTGMERKQVTAEEMEKMSPAEAAAPLLDAAFGTLLAYADKSSTSRVHLSRFGNSPAWQIDSSEKGNTSFFGEDWGPPPKRIGRDPRYQPVLHNPSSTQWEY